MKHAVEKLLAAGLLGLSAIIGVGALEFKAEVGYSGVGPGFVPLLVALVLGVCGALLMKQACSEGGFKQMPEESADAPPARWVGMALLSAGLLANAAAITKLGFVLSCALLFVLAARGFRVSMGAGWGTALDWLIDALIGVAISAPVYWMFTKLLGLTLPGLTGTGWI